MTVLLIGVLVYLLLASAILGWVLLPSWRAVIRQRLGLTARATRRPIETARRRIRAMATASIRGPRPLLSMGGLSRHQRLTGAAALLVLVLAPATAWWARQGLAYDDFDHTHSHAINPQIAALLQGEQLVPPAPLPPAIFLTREVERLRPQTASASRQWSLLDREFRDRLLAVYRLMRERHGLEMVLLEGYRSPERQAALAALGPQVTQAGPGASYHQHGLAADSAFLIGGQLVISEADPRAANGYELFGALAQSAGLVWGGSWRSLKDLGHVELRRPGTLPERSSTGASDASPRGPSANASGSRTP